MPMKARCRGLVVFVGYGLATLALLGCDDDPDGTPGDGGVEDALDAGLDTRDGATPDASSDAGDDVPSDAVPDAPPDVGPDGGVDTEEDAADAGSDAEPDAPVPTYAVGGRATGVPSSAVLLRNNGGDDLALPAGDSDFVMPSAVPDDTDYTITVHGFDPEQHQCTVSNGSGRIDGAAVSDVRVACIPVLAAPGPLYVENGAAWNDYVANDGRTPFEASGTPCSNMATFYDSCLHGGEMRMLLLDLPGITSCAGLSAEDDAGAMEWTCDDLNGVRLVSTRLVDGRGLSDLIDFGAPGGADPAWRELSLTIRRNGTPIATTAPAAWWNNALVVTDGAGEEEIALAVAGAVNVVRSDAIAAYRLAGESIGLVVQPGVRVTGTATYPAVSVTLAGGYFLWIEGAFAGTVDLPGIELMSATHSVLNEVDVQGGNGAIVVRLSHSNRLEGLHLSPTTGSALELSVTEYNRIERVTTGTCSTEGVMLSIAADNILSRIRVTDCDYGVRLGASSGNLLWQVEAENSRFSGLEVESSDENRFLDVTVRDGAFRGVHLGDSWRNELVGVHAIRNDGPGVVIEEGSEINFVGRLQAVQNDAECILVSQASINHLVDVACAANRSGPSIEESSGVRLERALASGGERGAEVVDGERVVIDELVVANVELGGMFVSLCDGCVVADATLVNGFEGARLHNSVSSVLANVVTVNQGLGLMVIQSQYSTIVNLATGHNSVGVRSNDSSHNLYSGALLVHSNSSRHCFILAGEAPGLNDPDCQPLDRSDHTVIVTPLAGSLLGKVMTDDAANPDDNDGAAAWEDITEWLAFEAPYRAWGRDGGDFPAVDQIGPCSAENPLCRIWDWRLRPEDTTLRDALPLPDDADPDDDFLVAHLLSDGVTAAPFLRNVVELHGLDGNDDGLCQNAETCVASRHFGGFQGGGNPVQVGTFDPEAGPIAGVRLLADNGSTRIDALRAPELRVPPPEGTLVRLENVVITNISDNTLNVEDRAPGDHSGLQVFMPDGPPHFLAPGMVLTVYGEVSAFADIFQLREASWTVLAQEDPLTPALVAAGDLQAESETGEALESRLVELRDVYVVGWLEGDGSGAARDAFWVSQNAEATDCSAGCALVDDRLLDGGDADNDLPAVTVGQHLESVTGLVNGFQSQYALEIRQLADIVPGD